MTILSDMVRLENRAQFERLMRRYVWRRRLALIGEIAGCIALAALMYIFTALMFCM